MNGRCVRDSVCRDSSSSEEDCDTNEVWKRCGRTCDEKCDPRTESCSNRCRTGCFCRSGYVRILGQCVRRSSCPTGGNTCDALTEKFVSTCTRRCSESCNDGECLVDRRPCETGCFCRSGYRRVLGVCVPQSQCTPVQPTCTRPNEVFTACGRPCQDECTVTNQCRQDVSCTTNCICAHGFKRINGQCVASSQCNIQCGANASFRNASPCDENCPRAGVVCSLGTENGCYCNVGFKRRAGKCVPDFCANESEV